MAVFRKKRENGTLSKNWYYNFIIGNKRFSRCTFTSSKKEALEIENERKSELRQLYKGNVSEKNKQKNLTHFREKITSEIQGDKSIKLEDIWETFRLEAPAKMKRIPNEKGWSEKEAYLKDFLHFINDKYTECKTMRDVTASMAEQYIGLIKTSGRYFKEINCNGKTYHSKITKLSNSSINEYITQLKQIFTLMAKAAGLMENPFEQIPKLPKESGKRHVFEVHELEKINSFFDRLKKSSTLTKREQFNYIINEALFVIGINTGMRRGDIALLKWSDVNFTSKVIEKVLRKVKIEASIPMSRKLYDFLKEKHSSQINEYVTPELASMYIDNADGISYRFKMMLKELDIESLKSHSGRSRKSSSKDIHSLRHTFCYLHGMQGTPLVVVQSMVGHMERKMTESYMMHRTEELKREAIEKFSLKPFQPITLDPLEEIKNQAIEMINSCSSEEDIYKVLNVLQSGIKRLDGGGSVIKC